MPFRDREWEDFQRDCDFFPAYTDFIFGVITRPEVEDEPGLHPQIFEPQPLPQPPPQRLYGLPPPQLPVAYDAVCTMQRASMLRQDSSIISFEPSPCPAPRLLPAQAPQEKLLHPNELLTDPAYSFIPQQHRMVGDKNIARAWSTVNSDASPVQKAQAMAYIQNISRGLAKNRQEREALQVARLQAETTVEEVELHDDADQATVSGSPVYHETHGIADSLRAERGYAPGYAIRDLSQLPAYVQSQLAQLCTCTEILALQEPPTDEIQMARYQQAQQYYLSFTQSVPPPGLKWIKLVVEGILRLRKQGGDPMAVLKSMPRVESTL